MSYSRFPLRRRKFVTELLGQFSCCWSSEQLRLSDYTGACAHGKPTPCETICAFNFMLTNYHHSSTISRYGNLTRFTTLQLIDAEATWSVRSRARNLKQGDNSRI